MTRLPTPRVVESRPDDLARASPWFPAAGLVIGACLALIARIFQSADPWIVALAVVVAWIWITGALHLDGLGDVADAARRGHRAHRPGVLAALRPDRMLSGLGAAQGRS
ncbi:adenosylcobinamide-GDP ribazoletransferase [Bradyrhizobium sp.]|uniref:adenosylcobinamide-GDP ribazoletransferase n=1 Tax=Bradyrhizobium sp. TaxID=376 RepID=UPI00290BE094|nr:adenosylcobinamide-GDP ribazoletransferase [Bradyrhizobium sp.]MDU6489948.1 adenosylcobinamide-GDP ribazoletransferase [Bradyrhizobium sp.]